MLVLNQAKADGTYSKSLQQLARLDVLIMDDRNGSSSTVIISQLPTEKWYQSIGDNTVADAILDRLMHNAYWINLKGESMRKLQSDSN
ncbi:MAG: DNA replication protein DnaC [Paraglaciecola sp.]|jgi:DNA replication protein DnaC